MPARKTSKKKTTKTTAAKLSPTDAKKLRQTIKLDQLSQNVGTAVQQALRRQDLGQLRGPIIMGIIYDPRRQTFAPYLQAK